MQSIKLIDASSTLQVRLYDPKTSTRRPVVDCKPEEGEAWTTISIACQKK